MRRIAALCIIVFTATAFGATEPNKSLSGLELELGYKVIPSPAYSYSHNTHPDDYFLPNADMPGSAGVTSFDAGNVSAGVIGLRYRLELVKHVSVAVGGGYQFNLATAFREEEHGNDAGNHKSQHMNNNDDRGDFSAFVYTHRNPLPYYLEAELVYHFDNNWYVGVEYQFTGVEFESGWDRWSSFKKASSTTVYYHAVGPVVGVMFDEKWGMEGTVLFFEGEVGGGISLFFRF